MHTPNPNSKQSTEIETILESARFRPDVAFEERLRAQLIEAIPEPPKRTRWSALRSLVLRDDAASTQPNPLREPRWIAAFSVLMLGLMAYLFVQLVLIRPSSFGTAPTETPTITPDLIAMPGATGIIFGEEIELTETRVEKNGDTWTIYLWWRALKPPTKDYDIAIFAGGGDQLVGQIDAPLRGGDLVSSNSADWDLLPTQWQVDHPIASTFRLTVIAGSAPVEGIAMEVRDPDTGVQLHLEKDGYSLSTIRAYVWSEGLSNPTAVPTPIAGGTPSSPENPVSVTSNPVMINLSADGQRLAIESQPSSENWSQINVINLTSGQTTFIADGAWPSLNADGSSVAFVIRPRTDFQAGWNRINIINTANTDASAYFDVSSNDGLMGQPATMPDLSADGQVVAFLAQSTDVQGMPSNPLSFDVYVLARGGLERIAPEEYGDAEYISAHPSISADGRYVAFNSGPTNLDLGLRTGVFVWDRVEKTLTLVGDGIFPEISADGSTVAYLRFGSEAGQGEGWINAVATNWKTGETRWLGRMLDASPDGGWIERVFSLSADGNKIAFWSVLEGPRDPIGAPAPAQGLGSAYSNRYLFVYDWATDTIERADPIDAPHPPGFVFSPSISADGILVAYIWRSISGDASNIFIRNLVTDQTQAVNGG